MDLDSQSRPVQRLAVRDGKLCIIETPIGWMQCSVSRDWYPPKEFQDDQGRQVRTNCRATYEMEGMAEFKKKCEAIWDATDNDSRAIRDHYRRIEADLSLQSCIRDSGYTVGELLDMLQKLPKDARVIMTQDGYYAEGILAYMQPPTRFMQHHKDFDCFGAEVYVIGHSSQNY